MRRGRRLIVFFFFFGLLVWFLTRDVGPEIQPESVLVLDLSGRYVEAAEPSLIGRLLGDRRQSFVSVWGEMRKVERDDRITGVVVRIRRMDLAWGMAQELRDSLMELRKSGRRTIAYLETGALGANREYYIATGADEIVISPGTTSPLIGLGMEFFFLGGLWEKIGAGIETVGSGEYKSGAETIAGTKMSPAYREMATSLLDSAYDQFVAGISEGRNLTPERVRELVDRAPITAEELQEVGLVDAVGHLDEAVKRAGGGEVVEAEDYARVGLEDVDFEPVGTIALVYGSGTVLMGEGSSSPTGSVVLTSDTVSRALEEAAEDPEVDAIVFRIDSPGGSPLASDIVWRAAEKARENGKPLIASVSNYAASGGYYVLCGADAVVASPGSLVGSIGVFVMRPVIGGLLEKLGIGFDSMTRGRSAELMMMTRPLTQVGRERLMEEILATYDLFVKRVSDGRELTPAEVHEIGRGRVWTGAQGLENGLVDELGGLRVAIDRAKVAAGLGADADVKLVPYPMPKTLVQQFSSALQGSIARATPRLVLPEQLRRLEAFVTTLPQGTPLLVPPFMVEIR
ncbi:MAG: signal peptide peptidase SppA [Myxococcales bacterium]|nr:signal peptide peptidase SppA [Myxococcales bacterium]